MKRCLLVVTGVLVACTVMAAGPAVELMLYVDLSTFPDQPMKAFDMLLCNGEKGFEKGLYVSTDFVGPHVLLLVEGPNAVTVVKHGIGVNESLIFAEGEYGDGMFITHPSDGSIQRLLPNGQLRNFTFLGSQPLGPSGMAYAPDGTLLVTNAYGGNVLRVDPDGGSSVFAVLPGFGPEARPFGITALPPSLADQFGGPLLVGTFETPNEEHNDKIYVLSANGEIVKELAEGLDHLEYMTPSPGEPFFEPGVVLCEFGTDVNGSGRVSILRPDGTIRLLFTGLDPTRVVFDTQGILSDRPAMYIADMNADITGEEEPSGSLPSRIWVSYLASEDAALGELVITGAQAGWWGQMLY